MTDSLHSPPSKRIKLEDLSAISISEQTQSHEEPPEDNVDTNEDADAADEDGENCSICLQSLVDRTVIPKCSHEFCFECLLLWTEQSRRCPLCTQIIGDYLIHSIRSRYDYRKHYLPPLRTSPPPSRPAQPNPVLQNTRHYARRRRREREWATQRRDFDESDRLERSIEMRRWIYRHDVYAKHVASNSFTKYRPYPTPAQFSASQDLISRTTTFLRRELQVWEGLDVEFLTTLIISLMKAIDIRSESAVKLISEFLDMDAPYTPGGRHVNAEHFAHEVYCYVRSPYKDLFVYDSVVQYEAPPGVSPPPNEQRHQGPRASSSRDQLAPSCSGQEQISSRPRSRSRSPPHSRIPNRSESWSPSGRKYSPLQDSKHGDVHELFTPRVLDETLDQGPTTSRRRNEGSQHYSNYPKDGGSRKRGTVSSHDHDPSKSSSSRRRAAPSSSTDIAEPSSAPNPSVKVKGKQRAREPDALADQDTSDRESGIEFEHSVPVLRHPLERYSRNDVDHSSDLSTTPPASGSKTRRTPRIQSLVESVRAHLGHSNSSDTLAPEIPEANTNNGVRNSQAQTLSMREAEIFNDRDTHLTSSSVPQVRYRGLNDLRGGATNLDLEDVASNSMAVDDIGIRARSQDKRSSNGNLQDAAAGLDSVPKINGTQLKSPLSLPIDDKQFISTLNNTDNMLNSSIDNTGTSARAWPPNADSQSCAATSRTRSATQHDDGDHGLIHQHHNTLDPISQSIGREQLTKASPIADGLHVSPTHPSHANIPFESTRHAKSASITVRDDRSQQFPHTQPQNTLDRRTRLLARLHLEKTQAQGGAHSEKASKLHGDKAEARGLRDTQALPSLYSRVSSMEDVGASMEANSGRQQRSATPLDRVGDSSVSRTTPNARKRAQSDPESASECIAEEARVKEAKLRVRAQLRARLAAEKRRADGG